MSTSHQSERPSILIVEDHEDTACLVQFVLEREGYAVTCLPNGRAAQRMITSAIPPQVVLLDIGLPDMTGLDLLRVIRTTPEWQWIPVLLLTADTRSETMIAAAHLGATEYLQKPFAAERLLASVRRFLSEPHQRADKSTNPDHGATPIVPHRGNRPRGSEMIHDKGDHV
ncbi:MAG: response regulator transcription factor [Nitrospira sp.]|nr:response regulator transcription factor [Nitrospira sp.]